MASKARDASEPDWLDLANNRKTPFTDAELDRLALNFLALNRDVAIRKALIARGGELDARAVVKQRLAARDPNSLINWLSTFSGEVQSKH
jgi:hypothetical protein